MKHTTIRAWTFITLFSLFIVACLGLLMRFKILFPLPWINQRFILHAHSHFAFSGWISQALMLAVSATIFQLKRDQVLPSRYNLLLAFNLFCAYGMLVSFILQGYAAISIAFSTLSILVGFIFYWFCKKDMESASRKEAWWKYMHAAMVFNILSCLGTFSLAWTMVMQPGNTELRMSSVYFYLHFQYNGWFFFACMGLFHYWLKQRNVSVAGTLRQYYIFVFSCAPMYLLSINWMAFPVALHVVSILTALIQFTAFLYFARSLYQNKNQILEGVQSTGRYLLISIFIAMSIKFTLQTASSLPAMAQIAFGLRTVVIAYLHLVLLGIISLFLIFWFYTHQSLTSTSLTRLGIVAFISGVILNEFFLMIQGLGAISGIYVGYMPEALTAAGLIMVGAMGMIVVGIRNKPRLSTQI
jgi:hypothetical protein